MPHSAESFRRGKPLVFINFGYRKSLDKWVGVSIFSVEKFMPHSAEVFRRGETFSVSLIWGIEKVWIRVVGGEYQGFPSNFFCLTVTKSSVGGNPLVLCYFPVSKKFV